MLPEQARAGLAQLTGVRQACEWGCLFPVPAFGAVCVCLGMPLQVGVSGVCVGLVSAHCSDLPLAFLLPSGANICLPPSAPSWPTGPHLQSPALPRLLLPQGAYHFQGPGAEWLAERWSPDGAGSPDFLYASILEPRLHGDRFSGLPPCLPEASATSPGRCSSSLRCGPWRTDSAAFCFPSVQELPKVQG